jgi:hypothetical protein
LSNLSEDEVPGKEKGWIDVVVIFNLLDGIGSVSSANVDFEGREPHPRVRMAKELRQDVKDGVLRVHNLLENIKIRLTVFPASLAVLGLNNRGLKDVFHLGSTLFQRRQSAQDKEFPRLDGNLGGYTGFQLRQSA